MNLRNISGEYNIGLDMGTGSVGWAVTDESGQLLHFKKKPTWGSRLFSGANTAAEARGPRSQRRRYVRRRWRLNLLQGLFEDEVAKVDPEFFIRLRQSRLLKEDRPENHRDYGHPLFNDTDFAEAEYYKRFPTIYHLRLWLMEADEKADIRLVYLALHNIVKCRGNFLRERQPLSSKNAKPNEAIEQLRFALEEWSAEYEYGLGEDKSEEILNVFADDELNPSDKKKAIAPLIGVEIPDDKAASKKCNEAIAGAIVGLKVEFKNIFPELEAETTNLKLSNDEAVESLVEACPYDSNTLLNAIRDAYSAYLLQGLLSYKPGESISANMVAKYVQYGKDLKTLKDLARKYASKDEYREFFRGTFYEGTDIYDASKAKGYTRYNLGNSKLSYDDFATEVKKLFAGTDAVEDKSYTAMMEGFEKQTFLRRLKTSDNGSIYYQLHLEEMQAIIANQSKHYPFLARDAAKLESLVTFRIPYYVGPLSDKDAPRDKHGKRRFSWAEHIPGKENVPIRPWNWDQVIDKDKAAEDFILRMTGMCTYLQGEDVLPRNSLLYEEFCVLNELNGLKVSVDGDKEHRLDAAQREGIVKELFHRYKSVSYKKIAEWLEREGCFGGVHVSGGQGANGLESKMSSYVFFCKDVFHIEELDLADYPMVEEIILWNTLFEDRRILKAKLESKYGEKGNGALDAEQIKTICKKRFTGWGRLSRKFLTGLKVQTECGTKSIMDVLREGDPNSTSRRGHSMVLMEVLRDDDLRFQAAVDKFNEEYFGLNGKSMDVNELPGSPAIRRSLNQAMRIVDEIAGIAGKAPANIFVEVTREDDPKKKGQRTKRRINQLKEALEPLKKEDPELWKEFSGKGNADFDERMMLYFAQRGKCLYSKTPIDINQLYDSGLYEVDHIIPRAYIKDDSLENKALVLRTANQRKTDALLIDSSVRQKMSSYWRGLHEAKLIGDKKYNNLLRSEINEKALKGFVARQLVETSQMVKLIQALLNVRYPETKIVPVKASLTHNLREDAKLIKCREANDYHHAHDAYLACRMGLFIQLRYPVMYENPIAMTRLMKEYVRKQAEEFKKTRKMPMSSGFIVGSFVNRDKIDIDTGEFVWDAEAELEGIRKALDYRQCYITRMPYEDTGVYWDATIYSPRDAKMGKKLNLPVKDGLDPHKYGGFSCQQFAYFFIYEAKKTGKTERRFCFEPVPVWLASRVDGEKRSLELYAKELAEGNGTEFVRIVRAKILKEQLLEIGNGNRLALKGAKEVRNATQLFFSQAEQCVFAWAVDPEKHKDKTDGEYEQALNQLLESCLIRTKGAAPGLAKRIAIDEKRGMVSELELEIKKKLLRELADIVNGKNRVIDLTAFGGAKMAGAYVVSFDKELGDGNTDFYIIDQSVTGMFERKTRVGL